jgi:mono/diheme cytochrome c family protein
MSRNRLQGMDGVRRCLRRASRRLWLSAVAQGTALVFALPAVVHSDDAPTAARQLQQHIRPFFKQHCFECHSGDQPEGDLRLD